MAANAFSSSVSKFEFNGNVVYAIGSMAASFQRPALDITPIGTRNSYFINTGNMTSVITLDVFYACADHGALVTELFNPTAADMPFVITFNDGDTINGYCIVTQFDSTVVTSDVVRGSFTLQVNGQLQYAACEATVDVAVGVIENPPEV